jgi:tetratricopeptide (TPR) repeat protein
MFYPTIIHCEIKVKYFYPILASLPLGSVESPQLTYALYAGAAVLVLLLLLGLWSLFGTSPRFHRKLKSATKLLDQGQVEESWQLMAPRKMSRLSPRLDQKLKTFEARYLNRKCDLALQKQQYEEAVEFLETAYNLLGKPPSQARANVLAGMLSEVRRLFAMTTTTDQKGLQDLIARVLLIDPRCAEAYFWQSLSLLRQNKKTEAIRILSEFVFPGKAGQLTDVPVSSGFAEKFIDPPLYLGVLLLDQKEPREALRVLTEANRIDGNCPFVVSQLGIAMIEAGGDTQFAIRALQRALGQRGFSTWTSFPKQVWVEAFPENLSYIRRLAQEHPFVCPIWGEDYRPAQRQATAALAKAYYQLNQFQQAVELYQKLASESAPSLAVLRGLGLSLARLERYDEAFKHLRAAHELENPKDPITTGYLALCGAKGKPARPEDKANNVAWAVWLVRELEFPGENEWVNLLSQIYQEARDANVPLTAEDQVNLCNHLLRKNAIDAGAAQAYQQLFLTARDVFRPEFAFVFCRAVEEQELAEEKALDIFALLFSHEEDARAFFAERKWDFAKLEYAYLEKFARWHPGQLPPVFGEQARARVEQILTGRIDHFRGQNQLEEARAAAQVWVKLLPTEAKALDSLAQLHYQTGDSATALEVLRSWQQSSPQNSTPLLRQAVLYQHLERWDECQNAINQALNITSAARKGEAAYLGAKLLLSRWQKSAASANSDNLLEVRHFLEQSLAAHPGQKKSLTMLAAVLTVQQDREALRALRQALAACTDRDPLTQFFLALCHLESGDHEQALEAGKNIAENEQMAAEASYLIGWAFLQQNDSNRAAMSLLKVALDKNSPSRPHALALLGCLRFYQGSPGETVSLWQELDAAALAGFGLAQPLGNIIFLAALNEMQQGQYSSAADKLRQAGKAGLRDPRLAPLLSLCLFKAGQSLMVPS